MILSMSGQSLLFLSTVASGAVIGLAYDIFRIIRKTAPHKNVMVQLEDLVFWLFATLCMFYFMLNKNYGEIRFFVVLGVTLGMVLYFATISKLIMFVSVAVVDFLKRVVATAMRIILLPLRILIKKLTPPIKKAARFINKYLHSAQVYGKMKVKRTAKNWSIIRKKV